MNIYTLTILTIIGATFTGFSIGYTMRHIRELFWRLQWIDMEHRLARFENREPREISFVEPGGEMNLAKYNMRVSFEKHFGRKPNFAERCCINLAAKKVSKGANWRWTSSEFSDWHVVQFPVTPLPVSDLVQSRAPFQPTLYKIKHDTLDDVLITSYFNNQRGKVEWAIELYNDLTLPGLPLTGYDTLRDALSTLDKHCPGVNDWYVLD